MLQSIYAGANAISTYKNSLIASANNVANINTPYYKSNSLQLADLKQGGVNVSSIRQNQQLSYTIASGRTLDFVIDGPGQFKLDNGGEDYFTRRGVFYLDAAGNVVDGEGRMLLADVVRPDETEAEISIDDKGVFSVDGEKRGKIDVYDNKGNKQPEDTYKLKTGVLEASDVNFAREIVDMMMAQRSIEANYGSIRANNEMLGVIINLVG